MGGDLSPSAVNVNICEAGGATQSAPGLNVVGRDLGNPRAVKSCPDFSVLSPPHVQAMHSLSGYASPNSQNNLRENVNSVPYAGLGEMLTSPLGDSSVRGTLPAFMHGPQTSAPCVGLDLQNVPPR